MPHTVDPETSDLLFNLPLAEDFDRDDEDHDDQDYARARAADAKDKYPRTFSDFTVDELADAWLARA